MSRMSPNGLNMRLDVFKSKAARKHPATGVGTPRKKIDCSAWVRLKRARRSSPAIKNRAQMQRPKSPARLSCHKYMRIAGARQNETPSLSESSCMPSGLVVFAMRAMRPSSESMEAPARMQYAAATKSPAVANTTEQKPKKALPRVKMLGKMWSPRSM